MIVDITFNHLTCITSEIQSHITVHGICHTASKEFSDEFNETYTDQYEERVIVFLFLYVWCVNHVTFNTQRPV